MKLGKRGEDLIKSYESLRLEAYMPTAKDRPTIGWGHTRGVKLGDTCTVEQAQQWFNQDVSGATESVERLNVDLTQAMSDALISLVFNAGAECLEPGKVIGTALRVKDYYSAWAGFALWRKQAGKNLLGLARRRAKEMMLFLEDGIPK